MQNYKPRKKKRSLYSQRKKQQKFEAQQIEIKSRRKANKVAAKSRAVNR